LFLGWQSFADHAEDVALEGAVEGDRTFLEEVLGVVKCLAEGIVVTVTSRWSRRV
jgi:hypothetical protein